MIKPLNLPYDKQVMLFEKLLHQVEAILQKFGRPLTFHDAGDYLPCSDFGGYPQVLISIKNLSLLRPHVIDDLRQLLRDLHDWEIVIAVAIEKHLEDWPVMGLYIRQNEIIDGLQRQYLPAEFRDIAYKDGRPGTQAD